MKQFHKELSYAVDQLTQEYERTGDRRLVEAKELILDYSVSDRWSFARRIVRAWRCLTA